MKNNRAKNERKLATIIVIVLLLLLTGTITPVVLVNYIESKRDVTYTISKVTFNTYKNVNGQNSKLNNEQIFMYTNKDESSEHYTVDIETELEKDTFLLLEYKIENKQEEEKLNIGFDFSQITSINCIVTAKEDDNDYKAVDLENLTYTIQKSQIKTIIIKIGINDLALNSVFTGKLSIIIS